MTQGETAGARRTRNTCWGQFAIEKTWGQKSTSCSHVRKGSKLLGVPGPLSLRPLYGLPSAVFGAGNPLENKALGRLDWEGIWAAAVPFRPNFRQIEHKNRLALSATCPLSA